MKLYQGKFTLDTGKMFFIGKVICHQNRLLREVIMAPNLAEFKEHLNDFLSDKS